MGTEIKRVEIPIRLIEVTLLCKVFNGRAYDSRVGPPYMLLRFALNVTRITFRYALVSLFFFFFVSVRCCMMSDFFLCHFFLCTSQQKHVCFGGVWLV